MLFLVWVVRCRKQGNCCMLLTATIDSFMTSIQNLDERYVDLVIWINVS